MAKRKRKHCHKTKICRLKNGRFARKHHRAKRRGGKRR